MQTSGQKEKSENLFFSFLGERTFSLNPSFSDDLDDDDDDNDNKDNDKGSNQDNHKDN